MLNHRRPRRDRSHSDAFIYLDSRSAGSPVTIDVSNDLSPSSKTFSPAKKVVRTQRPRSKSEADSNHHHINSHSNIHYHKRIPSGKVPHITAGYHHSNHHHNKSRRLVLAQHSKDCVLGKMWIRPFTNTPHMQVGGGLASRSKTYNVSQLCVTGPQDAVKKNLEKDSLLPTKGKQHSLDFSPDSAHFDDGHPVPRLTSEIPHAHGTLTTVAAFGESGKPLSYFNAPSSPYKERSNLSNITGNSFMEHSFRMAGSQQLAGTALSSSDDKRCT